MRTNTETYSLNWILSQCFTAAGLADNRIGNDVKNNTQHTPLWLPLPVSLTSSVTILFFILTINWHLSVAACNTTTTSTIMSPCGHLKSCVANIPHTKSFALHSLKRESTCQRESKLICVWNANVTSLSPSMCLRALRASGCCKTHLLCMF